MIDSKRSSHKSMKIIFHNEDQYENDEIEKSFLNITNKIERFDEESHSKNILKNIILESTNNDSPNLMNTNNPFYKIIWFIAFLIASSLSIFTIKETINIYLNYEVITNFDLVYEQPALFPTISFQFDYGFSKTNYSLEGTIVKLYFNNRELKNISNEFQQIKLESGKIFYKFNSGKNIRGELVEMKYQKNEGYYGGLTAEIFFGLPENFEIDPTFLDSHNNHFCLYIHNLSINSVESTDEPIKLSTG